MAYGFFRRRRRDGRAPVDIEDGIAYYGNEETDEAYREVEEKIRRGYDPRDAAKKRTVSRSTRAGKFALEETPRYLRDRKALEAEGYDMDDLDYVISMLIRGDNLPKRFKNHKLKGKYSGAMECHIDFDWILVYRYDCSKLVLYAIRTRSHKNVLDI